MLGSGQIVPFDAARRGERNVNQERIRVMRDHWQLYRDNGRAFFEKYPTERFCVPVAPPTRFVTGPEVPPPEPREILDFILTYRHGVRIIECEGIMLEAW